VEELIQALLAAGVLAEAEAQGKALIAEARKGFADPGQELPLTDEGRALLAGLIDLIT
jgi:hypothetical protein